MITMRIHALSLGLLCLFLLEGAAAAGKVENGVYVSPLNNFTVPIPDWRGLKIQDRSEDDFAIVSFLDRSDFPAPLQSVVTLRLPADAEQIFLDPSKRDAALQSFLTGFVMPHLFQNVAPGSIITHRELLDDGDRRFYFAVANIPEGHTFLHNPNKGKQDDSVSGLLIFQHKGFMYMVRLELRSLSNPGLDATSLSLKDLESARRSLLRIVNTMKFTN